MIRNIRILRSGKSNHIQEEDKRSALRVLDREKNQRIAVKYLKHLTINLEETLSEK